MYNNILLFESILGTELFEKEVEVLLTDRGSEFTMAEEIEKREDRSRRTRVFYCENIFLLKKVLHKLMCSTL